VTGFPLVSVVIPAKNEEADIEGCLEAIASQDYPVNRLEVIVVEGGSTDGTARVAAKALSRFGFAGAHVVLDPVGTTPSNLNSGLARATGEILCRVDARTRIQPHYIRTCVELLTTRPEISVVGGAQVALARDASPQAQGISRALNNRYAMGGSRYRRAASSGPSDTVYLGAFRTTELRAIGGWDARLLTNQDFDLNRRMTAFGLVWFDARLRSGYLPRGSYRALWRQYVRFGKAKVQYWRMTGDRPRNRQVVAAAAGPLGFVTVLASVRRLGAVRTAIGAVTVLMAVEVAGQPRPRSLSPLASGSGALGVACVVGGWLTGLWVEILRR
jgi:succinoglycan biosynthesis protein ExoA